MNRFVLALAAGLGLGLAGAAAPAAAAPHIHFGFGFGMPGPWVGPGWGYGYPGFYPSYPRQYCYPVYRTKNVGSRKHPRWVRVYAGQRCTWGSRYW